MRVLIVDDSADFRVTASELLEHRGYVVIGEAASAGDALRAIDTQRPDVVLLDLGLDQASGGEVGAYLRAHHPAMAVLLVSANPPDVLPHLDGDASGAFGPVAKHELARIDLTQFWP